MLSFLVGEDETGERLDRALAALAGVPRARAQRWIDAGRVRVDGRLARAAERVRAGARLEAEPPEVAPCALEPEPIALRVLFEDADVVVVDKPAGLVVHPAPGHASGTLVNALLHHCRDLAGIGGRLRPGIVHRLDRGTSGVLVVAKSDDAHVALAAQFREHTIERVYAALVRGVPGADAGRVERAIGRHPHDRKRMSVRTQAGRAAVTAWRVRRRFATSGASLLEVHPETGRTHQIRVHLASVGLPIAGDPVYGRNATSAFGLERPALHAELLGFDHPRSGARLRFEAALPEDLVRALATLEARETSG